MPRPRKQQISLDATPFYHCVSRCVRRAFLCGKDPISGRSYEHRRHRIEYDILRLASIFYIDVAAFCVMSNHHHLVLHVDRDRCKNAYAKDIVVRWHQLFKANVVSQKFVDGEPLEKHEQYQLDTFVDIWRVRLHDISWFMKVLNENIARMANREDECTGHFWESRFKSQALLDEKAVLSAMAYIDLNPIRAGIASTPETSNHTSIKLRISHWQNKAKEAFPDNSQALQPESLLPFSGNHCESIPGGMAFNLIDYIELVDWSGRAIQDDKRGAIAENTPCILQRIGITPEHWIELSTHFESRFKGIAGSVESVRQWCEIFGLTRTTNRSNSEMLYG